MPPLYAVITTYNRPDVAMKCIETISADVDTILVVDNGSEHPMPEHDDYHSLAPWYIIRDDTQPVNLSSLWNLGLDWCTEDAMRMEQSEWDVAILNDDLIVPAGWAPAVQAAIRETGAAAGCSHYGMGNYSLSEPGPVPLSLRMTGYAFMLRGESGLRADENLHWWFGDDDLDWQARLNGGMVSVNYRQPDNLYENGFMTPERQVRSGMDRAYFKQKWGRTPW